MRIAFFTPLEPVRSGIAAYSADLLPRLADRHQLDIIVEETVWQHWADRAPAPRPLVTQGAPAPWTAGDLTLPLWRAHDFLPRHLTRPYDLIVYQLGNATCHEYMWPYLMRYPGLIVLHDGQLHHARAYALLRRQRQADYRAEFAYAHPGTPPEVAEFVVAGLQGPAYYLWPFTGPAVRRARAVAVHNPRLADDLRETYPDQAIETIHMGVPPVPDAAPPVSGAASVQAAAAATVAAQAPLAAAASDAAPPSAVPTAAPAVTADRPNPFAELAEALRRRQTPAKSMETRLPRATPMSRNPITFAAFGLVTPEKRIPQILRALAAIAPDADVRLRLVGGAVPHYDALADAAALGIADRVELAGFVPDAELNAQLAACDVCLNLRWPTSRETSASWLRCLAAGKPTIVNDLADGVDVPTLDPRTWTVLDARTDPASIGAARTPVDPVAVSIDILDEEHSLQLAMQRLAHDGALRTQLGETARAHWAASHTVARMVDDYERVLALAASRPAPDATEIGLPAHLLEDHSAHARKLAASVGVTLAW